MKMKMLHLTTSCPGLSILAHGQRDYQNPGFISIDCGAPDNYHDNERNIYYNSDDGFVDSGIPMQVSTQYDQRSKNLRVFENGARNCYTLRPNQGKGHRYLVRASFLYGNYDGKNQTPVFDLHIDVNYWATVNFSSYVYEEIMYTPPANYIQVCLVNIGLGVPFISAIELRLLDDSIYKVAAPALVTTWRFDLGSDLTYRHPEDEYDRIWKADTISAYPQVINTTDIVISPSINPYKVPPKVLMTAVQTTSVNDPLILFWPSERGGSKWYVYFHFAELVEQNGKVRNITVSEAYEASVLSEVVQLENRKPVTVPPQVALSGPYINCMINATANSDLPPLLNAIEFFTALELQNSPSRLDDCNIYELFL